MLALGLVQIGCAATSGQEWLNAPVDQHAALLPPSVETTEATPEAPQRLNHTVTLGESYATYPTPRAAAGGPAVQVNVPVVINNYAGYGAAYGYGSYAGYGSVYSARAGAAPVHGSANASQKVGADFPAVPSYGPRAMR